MNISKIKNQLDLIKREGESLDEAFSRVVDFYVKEKGVVIVLKEFESEVDNVQFLKDIKLIKNADSVFETNNEDIVFLNRREDISDIKFSLLIGNVSSLIINGNQYSGKISLREVVDILVSQIPLTKDNEVDIGNQLIESFSYCNKNVTVPSAIVHGLFRGSQSKPADIYLIQIIRIASFFDIEFEIRFHASRKVFSRYGYKQKPNYQSILAINSKDIEKSKMESNLVIFNDYSLKNNASLLKGSTFQSIKIMGVEFDKRGANWSEILSFVFTKAYEYYGEDIIDHDILKPCSGYEIKTDGKVSVRATGAVNGMQILKKLCIVTKQDIEVIVKPWRNNELYGFFLKEKDIDKTNSNFSWMRRKFDVIN